MCNDNPEFIKQAMEAFEEGVSAQDIKEEYANLELQKDAINLAEKESADV